MITSYRDFYKPGDMVIENDEKADQLIARGSAKLVETIEEAAPKDKMVRTKKAITPTCPDCGKEYKSVKSLKLHKKKAHK